MAKAVTSLHLQVETYLTNFGLMSVYLFPFLQHLVQFTRHVSIIKATNSIFVRGGQIYLYVSQFDTQLLYNFRFDASLI